MQNLKKKQIIFKVSVFFNAYMHLQQNCQFLAKKYIWLASLCPLLQKKIFLSHFSMIFWKKMIIEPLIKVSCYFLEPRDCSEGKWLWWGLPRDPWSPAELCPAFRCHSGDVCIRLILVLIFDCEKMLTLGAF